jgi:predicted HicB family RNase H-like nuclease
VKEKVKMDLDYYDNLPYTITLERWDEPDNIYWVARVLELPHCLTDGLSQEAALAEIKEVKREWLEINLKFGNDIPEPMSKGYSGQLRLRIQPSLHRTLAQRAKIEEVSLNKYMNTLLAQGVGFLVREHAAADKYTVKKKKKIPSVTE